MTGQESTPDSAVRGLDARVLRRRLNRRRMLEASALTGVGAAGFARVGCGDDDDEDAAAAQAEEAAPTSEPPAADEAPAAAEAGYAAGTPGAAPPKSSKDTLVTVVGTLPLGVDLDTSHGNPETWEAIANVNDGVMHWGWQKYPFDKPAEGIGTDYMSFNQDDVQPWLVQSFEYNEDFSSCTFHVRPGVRSFAGNELTSADFQWKVERALGVQGIGAFFASILNLDPSNAVEVIDKYTFKYNSTGPQYLLAPVFANSYWGVMDSTEAKTHATEEDPWAVTWMQTGQKSFGAYGIEIFEPGNQVLLVAPAPLKAPTPARHRPRPAPTP